MYGDQFIPCHCMLLMEVGRHLRNIARCVEQNESHKMKILWLINHLSIRIVLGALPSHFIYFSGWLEFHYLRTI